MEKQKKILWIISGISVAIALGAFVFLPQDIPIHFSNGIADEYVDKLWVFSFPVLELLLTLISHIESFKKWCMYGKTTVKTEIQYNVIILCVTSFITIVEIVVVVLSLLT